MKSLVLLYVEHGDTTDPLTALIDTAFFTKGAQVENYDLKVDVTEATVDVAQSDFNNL